MQKELPNKTTIKPPVPLLAIYQDYKKVNRVELITGKIESLEILKNGDDFEYSFEIFDPLLG